MKILLTVLCILFFGIKSNAQIPQFLWGKSLNTQLYNNSLNVLDANKNCLIFGSFNKTMKVDDNITLISKGRSDLFLIKYDPSGKVIWAKSFGDTNWDYASDIKIDADGNIMIVGTFEGSISKMGNTIINGAGSLDIYVCKLSQDGNVIWAKSTGGDKTDYAKKLEFDKLGNLYIYSFSYSTNFIFGGNSLKNMGFSDIVILKYDKNGLEKWGSRLGGNDSDDPNDIAIDINGNIYTLSYSTSDTFFCGNKKIGTGVNCTLFGDIFVAKIDVNGNTLWIKQIGDYLKDIGTSLKLDNSGNIYITGFSETSYIKFDNIELQVLSGNKGGAYIMKLDSDGKGLKGRAAVSLGYSSGTSLRIDKNQNIYWLGEYSGSDFSFSSIDLKNRGSMDEFLLKLDSNLLEIWGMSIGDKLADYPGNLDIDNFGNIYLAGSTENNTFYCDKIPFSVLDTSFLRKTYLLRIGFKGADIEALNSNSNFEIMPNPCLSISDIKFNEMHENSLLNITDISGKLVFSTTFSGSQFTFNREQLNSGIYFLQVVKSGNSSISESVVKKLLIH